MNTKLTKTLLILVFLWLAAVSCPAQKAEIGGLPRVGLIRQDQKIGGGKEGCGNHILHLKEGEESLIFVSDDEGFSAWMNLDGQNVELELKKTTLYHRDALDADAVYEYRYKNIFITVSLRQLSDYVFYFPAKIVVRRGRAARTIRAVVAPQCD